MLLTVEQINYVDKLRLVVSLQAQHFFWIILNMAILTKKLFFLCLIFLNSQL